MSSSLSINGTISPQRQSLIIQWNSAILTFSEIIREKSLQVAHMKYPTEILHKLKEIEDARKIASKQIHEIEIKIKNEMNQVQHERYALALNDTVNTLFNSGAKHIEYNSKLEAYMDISNQNSLDQRKASLPMDICIVTTMLRNSNNKKKSIAYLKELGQFDRYILTLYKCLEKEFNGNYNLPTKEELLKEYNTAYSNSIKGIFGDHTKVTE